MSEQTKVNTAKKVVKIILNVLMYVFFALCVFALVVTITSKRDADGTATIFGTQMRIVKTDSMAKSDETYDQIKQYKIKDIPAGAMVFIQTAPETDGNAETTQDDQKLQEWYAKLKVGDVLTFKYTFDGIKQEVITHRIVEITENGKGGYYITLEGDNRASQSVDVLEQYIDTSDVTSFNFVIGKVTGSSKFIGFVVNILQKPVGIILVVIVPCLIIMILEIIRLTSILGERKRQERKEKEAQQQSEIEMLKQQIAMMQQNSATAQSVPPQEEQTPPTEEEQ